MGSSSCPSPRTARTWFGLDAKLPEDGLVDAINRIARILGEVGDLKGDPLAGNPFSIVNSKPLRTLYDAPAELLANEVKTPGPTPMPGGAAFFRRLSDDEWKRVAGKVVGTLVDEPIIFGSGSSGVPEDFQPTLRDAIYKLAHYPKYRVIINGYVSPGSDPQADQQLSEERALVIKRYLVEQGGVQEDRIFAQGLGLDRTAGAAAGRKRCRVETPQPPGEDLPRAGVAMDNFRSTFPLDEAAIARQALGQVLTDPITWVPLVPAVAAYTIFDVPAVFSLGLRRARPRRRRRLLAQAMERHHRQAAPPGDRPTTIARRTRSSRRRPTNCASRRSTACAQKLEQFLAVKRQVEAAAARRWRDSPAQKMQLEQLVDSLCFGVRDQLQALALKENETAKRWIAKPVLAQVDAAFETLQSTVAELDTILGPADAPGGATQCVDRGNHPPLARRN